jgi:ATP-dependent Clp protease protease subunit
MKTAYLYFCAPINPDTANRFNTTLLQLAFQNVDKLVIAMSSSGGEVVPGITMHNTMQGVPFDIAIYNIGNIDSIANAVFLAGDERFSSAASTFMFHGVAFGGVASEKLDESVLRAKLDTILADQKRISDLIARNSILSSDECMALFSEQKTRSADWALEKGLICKIADFNLPGATEVHLITS